MKTYRFVVLRDVTQSVYVSVPAASFRKACARVEKEGAGAFSDKDADGKTAWSDNGSEDVYIIDEEEDAIVAEET